MNKNILTKNEILDQFSHLEFEFCGIIGRFLLFTTINQDGSELRIYIDLLKTDLSQEDLNFDNLNINSRLCRTAKFLLINSRYQILYEDS